MFQIVLTKADKAKGLEKLILDTAEVVAEYRAGSPSILATSGRTGHGIPQLRRALSTLALEDALH